MLAVWVATNIYVAVCRTHGHSDGSNGCGLRVEQRVEWVERVFATRIQQRRLSNDGRVGPGSGKVDKDRGVGPTVDHDGGLRRWSGKYHAGEWQVPGERVASTRLASGKYQASEWQVRVL
jgi:hypothetical protein